MNLTVDGHSQRSFSGEVCGHSHEATKLRREAFRKHHEFVLTALVRNYLEVYWPRAGGLSAMNAIGTQLRDPINSGLTRCRMAVINK